MPIDPEKLESIDVESQISTWVSSDAREVIDWLRLEDTPQSYDSWLLNLIGTAIEADAPRIRKVLKKPARTGDEESEDVLSALDRLCPPD